MKIVDRLRAIWRGPEAIGKLRNEVTDRIGERTTVHCDIRGDGTSNVIVVGRYRGHDYVRCFTTNARSFDALIGMLKEEEREVRRGRVDFPYASATYKRREP